MTHFLSHEPLIKFSSIYVAQVCCFTSVRVYHFLIQFLQQNVNFNWSRAQESNTGHWNRLLFDREEERYEIWETKFLGNLRSIGLKDAILGVDPTGKDEDNARNEEAYAELIQFFDDKSLSLIMKEAIDNRTTALNILCGHHAGQGKLRVISLYIEWISLKNDINESVTNDTRTETILTVWEMPDKQWTMLWSLRWY